MKKAPKDFKSYTLSDLLSDESFIEWTLYPNVELNAYWSAILANHPAHTQKIEQARKIILSLNYATDRMASTESDDLWQKVASSLATQKNARIIPIWLRSVAAATVAGLVMFGIFYQIRSTQDIEVLVPYGQVKTIKLPDNSEVTLNSNTTLRYARNWDKNKVRELWLNGEGFFKVVHLHRSGAITPMDRFIVHTPKVNIEVLGTTFNLSNRRETVKVALITGKIGLVFKSAHNKAFYMKPGDMVQYFSSKDTIVKKTGNALGTTLWKNGELNFDNTPVSEVFQYIEDIYGYKVIVKDQNIGKRKLSGTFTNKNEDDLIKALTTTLNISIKKNRVTHQLIISN